MSKSTRNVEKSWLDETRKRVEHQEICRQKMVEIRKNSQIDNEKELRSLDSTLKKTTAFMKKVKNLSAAAVPALILELNKLNLSKFVEEMAAAIVETKLKLSDLPHVADLCVAISARYYNFSEQVAGEFKKMLPLKKSDKITNAAKLRVDIIFLSELILCSVFNEKDGLQVLGGVLSYLVQTDKTEFLNVGLITTVCRTVGWQIANIVPIAYSGFVEGSVVNVKEEDLPQSTALSKEQKKSIFELLNGYYEALYKKTENVCNSRNKALKKVKRQERTRGDAGEAEKTELDGFQKDLDACKKLVIELSSAMGLRMKVLKEEGSDDEEDEAANLEMARALAEGDVALWNDGETKYFYENLMNLRDAVPEAHFKETLKRTIENTTMVKNIDEIDVENVNETGDTDSAMLNRPLDVDTNLETSDAPGSSISPTSGGIEEKGTQNWYTFVLDLDHLVNSSTTDKAAMTFVTHLNNKQCRKKLVKMMTNPPQSRLDLLPFYARFLATLENVMPDLVTEIVTQLLMRFREYMQKMGGAGGDKVEAKLACVMMIAELMKFKVISRAEGLSCLRQLVYDLRGHAVEMTAIMLESGGLYLYRHTDSHSKMKRLLEVVKAKRERMKDSRQIMLIDNAYFTCLPPEESEEERAKMGRLVEDTPMKRFIRQIVLGIDRKNVDTNLRLLRRLDWADKEIANYAIKYICSPWLLPLENLEHLASAIAGLSSLQALSWIGMRAIDSAIEIIRISLEFPGSFNQWAQSAAVYLAELYNFSVCEYDLIMKVLYELITFPEPEQCWKEMYRIRMVCALLKVCGEFFRKGSARKKIKCFMAYFHRYYFMKVENWEKEMEKLATDQLESSVEFAFPYEVEASYNDTIKQFRGTRDSKPPKNLEEAQQAVEKMEQAIRKTMEIKMEGDDVGTSRRSSPDLGAIVEEDEEMEENREHSDLEHEMVCDIDYEEEAKIQYEIERATKEEDDEFQRELDRLMGDSFRNSAQVAQNSSTNYDLSLSAAVRNRFERGIKFADDTKEPSSSEQSGHISMAMNNEEDGGGFEEAEKPKNRVTLITRGRGMKQSLKTVSIDDGQLREKWQKEKEREEKERADMKRLTLEHHQRIVMEEEKELLARINNRPRYSKKK